MDEREQNRKVRLCFTKNDDGSSTCKLQGCGRHFTRDLLSVLKRHLIRKHVEVAKTLKLHTAKMNATEIINSKFHKNIKVEIDKNLFYKYFVKLTTIHNVALAIMDFPATKEFVQSICKELKVNLNSKIGISAIKFCEFKIMQIIREEIKDKLISLKMDLATRYGRSVLGKKLFFVYSQISKVDF